MLESEIAEIRLDLLPVVRRDFDDVLRSGAVQGPGLSELVRTWSDRIGSRALVALVLEWVRELDETHADLGSAEETTRSQTGLYWIVCSLSVLSARGAEVIGWWRPLLGSRWPSIRSAMQALLRHWGTPWALAALRPSPVSRAVTHVHEHAEGRTRELLVFSWVEHPRPSWAELRQIHERGGAWPVVASAEGRCDGIPFAARIWSQRDSYEEFCGFEVVVGDGPDRLRSVSCSSSRESGEFLAEAVLRRLLDVKQIELGIFPGQRESGFKSELHASRIAAAGKDHVPAPSEAVPEVEKERPETDAAASVERGGTG